MWIERAGKYIIHGERGQTGARYSTALVVELEGDCVCRVARAHLTLSSDLPPHYHRDSTRYNTSMDFVDSVSKRFKKLKHGFKEHGRKRGKGSRSDSRGGGEHDTEGSETGQSSLPPPEAEGMAESGPSGGKKDGDDKKVVQGDPPTSGPSISPTDNAEPNGTWAMSL